MVSSDNLDALLEGLTFFLLDWPKGNEKTKLLLDLFRLRVRFFASSVVSFSSTTGTFVSVSSSFSSSILVGVARDFFRLVSFLLSLFSLFLLRGLPNSSPLSRLSSSALRGTNWPAQGEFAL